MVGAVFFPFLEISRMGFGNETSLFGVAMAFSHGALLPLTVALLATIVGLPVMRALLLVYTLVFGLGLPALWLDPLGGLAKNLVLLPTLAVLWVVSDRR